MICARRPLGLRHPQAQASKFTVTNDRPIRAVAMHILDRLEWA